MITLDWVAICGAIAALFAVYKGIIFLLDRYNVGAKRKEAKLMYEGMRNLMRETIRREYKESTVQGWIDEGDLEHVEKVYEVYHAIGGNGTGDRWMTELRKLPKSKEVE